MEPLALMDLADAKDALRDDVRSRLRAMSGRTRSADSRRLCDRILASEVYRRSHVVMGFLPLADEVDITPVLEAILSDGKRLAAPRIDWERKLLTPVAIENLNQDIQTRRRGVPEPMGDVVIELGSIDLVLTPGLAFDDDRRRLGRGGGFYDRFLARAPSTGRPFALGVAFDRQIVSETPADENDRPVDAIVTPTRWIGGDATNSPG